MEHTAPRRRSPGQLAPLPPDLSDGRAALAQELRLGRDKANIGLQDLASRTYSSKASVSRWLNGQALPTREQALRWAAICGTDGEHMALVWERAAQDGIDGAPPSPHLATDERLPADGPSPADPPVEDASPDVWRPRGGPGLVTGAQTPSRAGAVRRRPRRQALVALGAVLIVMAVVAAWLVVRGADDQERPAATSTPSAVTDSPAIPPNGSRPLGTQATGIFTSPPDGAGVRNCAYFTGTSLLPPGQTLILTKRNLTTQAGTRYVEYVFEWDDPSSLASWRGAQYFGEENDSVGQQYLVELVSVDLQQARRADTGTDAELEALADAGVTLDSRRVDRVPGQAPNDCPGP